MADISLLLRLINGVSRNVDISANTLVTTSIKVGGGVSNTELTKAILDNLVNLQNGTDFATGTNAHTHDGRYFTETELSDAVGPATGSDLIGDDNTYSNFTPAAATVKGALSGIDSALASAADEKVGVSATDTTPGYLDEKISVDIGTNATNALEATIQNPASDETYRIRFDASKVDHGALLGLADDDHTQYILVAGTRAFTGNQAMGGFKLTGLAAGSASGDSVRYEQVILANGSNPFTADQSMAGFKLTNVGDPLANGDAVNLAYLNARINGIKPKQAARVASTADIDLSVAADPSPVDGVTLADGDRILLKDQTAPEENGIYIAVDAADPTTWTRSTDFDSLVPVDEINGAWLAIQEGTSQAGQVWVQFGNVVTIGTDPITFEYWNPIAGLIGGDMITFTGSIFSVDLATDAGLESSNPGNAAGQLRVKLDGATLARSSSGLKVATGGISNNEVNAAAAIAYSKLALANSIVNADIATGAAIAYSKLALSNSIVNADIAAGAAIAYSKLALTNSIVNADIAAGAAIAYSKLALTNSIVLADLTSNSVDENKLTTSVAGAGLTGGGGAALSVVYAPSVKEAGVAGEAFAANTSFAVRMALTGETAGRWYKTDYDASVSDKFYAYGMIEGNGAAAKVAGDPIQVVMMGTITLGSSDVAFAAGEVGQAVHLKAAGAWDVVSQITYATDQASYRVGVAQEVSKILVGNMQLLGIN